MSTIKNRNMLQVIRGITPIVIKSSPLTYIILQISSVMFALPRFCIIFFSQNFFDKAEHFVGAKTTLKDVFIALLLLILIYCISQIMNGVENFVAGVFTEKSKGKLSLLVHNKIERLNPIDFEDTDKLDNINKAELGKNNAVKFVVYLSWIFSFYIPFFALMGWYLFTLKPILCLLVVIIFLPTLLSYIARTKIFSKLEDASAPYRRENEYYEKCIVDREYFKETRLWGGYGYFKGLFSKNLIQLNKLHFQSNLKSNLYELAMKLITTFGFISILYLLFVSVMDQSISIGAFAAVFAALSSLFSLMEQVVCSFIGDMTRNVGTINNFMNFMALEDEVGAELEIDFKKGIDVKDVSFTYPGKSELAIKNISFTIKPNERIAIVGENGSGKSTLLRLLTGMYVPLTGDVWFGENNTRTTARGSLQANMSAVFQSFQRYKMTLGNNIAISDLNTGENRLLFDDVCGISGFSYQDDVFPNGYETMLTREFGGIDLSGGYWQKIATARGLYRNHKMIVLDEPTAAIDPVEETKIYNRFARISEGKISIIVTHRLGSVKLVDRILVLKQGELIEYGTHKELMANNNEYVRLYSEQEQWYKDIDE